MIKKIRRYFLPMIMILSLFITCITGCKKVEPIEDDTITIVTTIFPIYDWVRNIVAGEDDIEVVWLNKNGTGMHDYVPNEGDLVKIKNADLFVCIGGESEDWVDPGLEDSKAIVLKLMNVINENTIKGPGDPNDEHIWLSLKNAKYCVAAIGDEILKLRKSERITQNIGAYLGSLQNLDDQIEAELTSRENLTVVFGDAFPFSYLMNDYNITAYSVCNACPIDDTISYETIIYLATKIEECNLSRIYVTEREDQTVAETIIDVNKTIETIAVLNSMEHVTERDARLGATYLGYMDENFEVLADDQPLFVDELTDASQNLEPIPVNNEENIAEPEGDDSEEEPEDLDTEDNR